MILSRFYLKFIRHLVNTNYPEHFCSPFVEKDHLPESI